MSSKKIQSRKASEVIRLKPFTRVVLDTYIASLQKRPGEETHVTHDVAVRLLLENSAKEVYEFVKKTRPDLLKAERDAEEERRKAEESKGKKT